MRTFRPSQYDDFLLVARVIRVTGALAPALTKPTPTEKLAKPIPKKKPHTSSCQY